MRVDVSVHARSPTRERKFNIRPAWKLVESLKTVSINLINTGFTFYSSSLAGGVVVVIAFNHSE